MNMSTYSLSHLSDDALLRDLSTLVERDHANTAEMLAHSAEVDARTLSLPLACDSMLKYCIERLYFSEEAAERRITAARKARELPVIFDAIADGRIHLTVVN